MASKLRPKTGKTATEGDPLLVASPDSLLNKCKAPLARSLEGIDKINFRRRDYARKQQEYSLVAAIQSRGLAREYYPVVPLASTARFTFWLAVAFRFAPHLDQYQLIHTSLIVFEGIATDPNKRPLIRAEWDEYGLEGDHAQPHWHVYPPGLLPEEQNETRFDGAAQEVNLAQEEADPDSSTREWDQARFHYAMATRWHLGDHSHQCRLSENALLNWLPNCISYTKQQLLYIDPPKQIGEPT
jgi:hypothetical protein